MTRQAYTPAGTTRFWTLLALLPMMAFAQVPVDEDGNEFGAKIEEFGDEGIPLLSDFELQELVGPVALYPDDLLAVVLPASTYPLQVIEAARFLEQLENDPNLKPNEEWDDSIIALINYPEVVELLNEDLDWTWRLGEAVVAQQADVIAAVEAFRDRAYAAGNLKSDEYQEVSRDEGVVSIRPVADDVIYVPYYEPARVIVRQPRPVYYYYPRPYPVYYYPYPDTYAFHRGYFWGVTTAFTIGWASDHLNVFHHSYHGHPYYGHFYWDRWWYRRPSITVHRNTYVHHDSRRITINRYYSGDRWRPTKQSGIVRHVTRNDYYPPTPGHRPSRASNERRTRSTHVVPDRRARDEITFRPRPERRASTPSAESRRIVTRQVTRQNEPRAQTRHRSSSTATKPAKQRSVSPPKTSTRSHAAPPRQRETSVQPRQRQSAPAPRQTRSAAAPRQRQVAPAPRQRQATPAPRQRQSAPPTRQRQSAPAPRQRQSAPAPRQRQSAPAPRQRQSAPAPRQREASPQPRQRQASPERKKSRQRSVSRQESRERR